MKCPTEGNMFQRIIRSSNHPWWLYRVVFVIIYLKLLLEYSSCNDVTAPPSSGVTIRSTGNDVTAPPPGGVTIRSTGNDVTAAPSSGVTIRSTGNDVTAPPLGGVTIRSTGDKEKPHHTYEAGRNSSFKDDYYSRVFAGQFFVDKTRLIKKYLQYSKTSVLVIRRPMKWGKSVNLKMIKRFLEIELDVDGKPLPESKLINRKLFTGGPIWVDTENKTVKLAPSRIANLGYTMSFQGTFPVIYLDFKADTGFMSTYEDVEAHLKRRVNRLFIDHLYLQSYLSSKDDMLTQRAKDKFNSYANNTYSREELKGSLRFLSKWLHKYHGKKVHILLDNCDSLVTRLYFNLTEEHRKQMNVTTNDMKNKIEAEVFRSPDFQRTLELLRDILEYGLADNEAVEKSMVTGILRLAKGDIFAHIANMTDFTVLDEEFSEYYGFTQNEVDDILYDLPFWKSRADIKKWYGGYRRIGHDDELELYNPMSLIYCLEFNGRLSKYWSNQCRMGMADYALQEKEVKNKLKELADGKSIDATVFKTITLDDGIADDAYSILLFTGYLTADNITSHDDGTYNCQLRVPNKEVKNMFEEMVKNS